MTLPIIFAAVFSITNSHGSITYYFDEKDREVALRVSVLNMGCKGYVPVIKAKAKPEKAKCSDTSSISYSYTTSSFDDCSEPVCTYTQPDIYINQTIECPVEENDEVVYIYEAPEMTAFDCRHRQRRRSHIEPIKTGNIGISPDHRKSMERHMSTLRSRRHGRR